MPSSSLDLRRATKGTRTRCRLLDVACSEFARLGYERTRVSDVAAKSAVTQSVFYQYFGGKRAIYDELIELFAQRMRAAIEQARIPNGTPLHDIDGRLRAGVRKLMAVLFDNPDLAKIALQNSAHAESLKSEFVDLLALTVKEEQQAGLWRRDVSPYWLSQALVGIMERVATVEQEAADLDDLSAFVADLVLNGIRAPTVGKIAYAPISSIARPAATGANPAPRPGSGG